MNNIINNVFSDMNLFLFFKANSTTKTIKQEIPKIKGIIHLSISFLLLRIKIGKLIKIDSLINLVVKIMLK